MTDPSAPPSDRPAVDPDRRRANKAFDRTTGYSGEDYDRAREAGEGAKAPSGHPLVGDPAKVEPPAEDRAGRDIPPEAGRRAFVDPKTGEVHGSGSGAGGGNAGEDYDENTAGA